MNQSQLSLFVEKMNSDTELRRAGDRGQKEAAARTAQVKYDIDAVNQRNLEHLRLIALEHGFDLAMDESRPDRVIAPSEKEMESISG